MKLYIPEKTNGYELPNTFKTSDNNYLQKFLHNNYGDDPTFLVRPEPNCLLHNFHAVGILSLKILNIIHAVYRKESTLSISTVWLGLIKPIYFLFSSIEHCFRKNVKINNIFSE